MKRPLGLAALLATLIAVALTGSASAATVAVQSISGDFSATNSTVTKTPDGVHFGTYADGGALGGTLWYDGFNGHKLSDLTDFGYTFTYRQAGSTTGAAPYSRAFLDTDLSVDSDGNGNKTDDVDADVVLDPSFCATIMPPQSTDLTYQMVGNSVRYSDDGCDGIAPDNQPWADVVAAHGNEHIVGLLVSQGNSTGTDVSAVLRNITVNGTTFAFNVPPADGGTGPVGPGGSNGTNGSNGQNGTTQIITRNVTVPGVSPVNTTITKPTVCTGNVKRTLHVGRRNGLRFVTAKAVLRGKHLPVSGRTITADLTGKAEGAFNIKITAKFRSAKTGRTVTRSETRRLSVACS